MFLRNPIALIVAALFGNVAYSSYVATGSVPKRRMTDRAKADRAAYWAHVQNLGYDSDMYGTFLGNHPGNPETQECNPECWEYY